MQQPTPNPVLSDPQMRACFDRLSPALQENILQSGIPMRSVQDIRAYAAYYAQSQADQSEQS